MRRSLRRMDRKSGTGRPTLEDYIWYARELGLATAVARLTGQLQKTNRRIVIVDEDFLGFDDTDKCVFAKCYIKYDIKIIHLWKWEKKLFLNYICIDENLKKNNLVTLILCLEKIKRDWNAKKSDLDADAMKQLRGRCRNEGVETRRRRLQRPLTPY
uniref:Uncharacterized protein n=1 Tax=Glossina austeni TaxID=7395 RepID=A0A1A9UYE4_GLOAU